MCTSAQEHLVTHMEDVLLWNPDVIVQWYNPRLTPQELARTDGWKELKAVKENRVYQLPSPFLCDFWTLKFIIAATYVSSWCHPAEKGKGKMENEQKRMLRYLYGKKGEFFR